MTLNAFFLFTLFTVLVALWEGGLGCDMGLWYGRIFQFLFCIVYPIFCVFWRKEKKTI